MRTRRQGDVAVIEIEDNGSGIPLEIRDRVFDPFFTTKDVGKGTGQGLSITRSVIVEMHGGSIEIDTRPGQGTLFRLMLPIDAGDPPAEELRDDASSTVLACNA